MPGTFMIVLGFGRTLGENLKVETVFNWNAQRCSVSHLWERRHCSSAQQGPVKQPQRGRIQPRTVQPRWLLLYHERERRKAYGGIVHAGASYRSFQSVLMLRSCSSREQRNSLINSWQRMSPAGTQLLSSGRNSSQSPPGVQQSVYPVSPLGAQH